ncbi:hypothetical protein HH310_11525 [Actinoplanes sp. TBRC 11911]|uniref:hypothetical protein n=1 Tax=Actinoplanes sp. TBRC 11911 TaxID=2729386 RepID=UPI00145CAAF7|nr:hypothetical protein [Actinoplanes sp. TBRC 11911]NMO51820.1 hypothetical protein [Actinoplanes sp. TBRC 11911]
MSVDIDAELGRLSHAFVTETLRSLDDGLDPTAIRQDVDQVVGRRTTLDPRTSVGLVVDLLWWLDTYGKDVAAKIKDAAAVRLQDLPPEQQRRLIEILDELAASEQHDGRRYQLRFFPYAMGLVVEQPQDAQPPVRDWIPSRVRRETEPK